MGNPTNHKYPLPFKTISEDVKDLKKDIEELKNSDGGSCEFNGYPKVDIEFPNKSGEINLEPNKYYNIYAYHEDANYININLIEKDNVTNHYIFNLELPCYYELRFDKDIKFINELPPLIDMGNCTISIFNGVGCFTIYNGNFEEK